jgi:hypothetical protein
MEKEPLTLTDEEIVSRILGLPMERVEYLKENHGLVCDEEGFSEWFIENAALVLEEKKRHFNKIMGFPEETTPISAVPAEPVL